MELKIAILDSLADDFEGIDQIKNYLDYIGKSASKEDIIKSVNLMKDEGLIFVNEEISDNVFTWYGVTKAGHDIWSNEKNE